MSFIFGAPPVDLYFTVRNDDDLLIATFTGLPLEPVADQVAAKRSSWIKIGHDDHLNE